jgi:hypothetical protein
MGRRENLTRKCRPDKNLPGTNTLHPFPLSVTKDKSIIKLTRKDGDGKGKKKKKKKEEEELKRKKELSEEEKQVSDITINI